MKKITFTSWCLLVASMFSLSGLNAQVNVNMPFNTGVFQTFTLAPPTVCSFNFFDNAGPAANYSNTSNPLTSVVTFAPSNAATHRVRVTFSSYSSEGSFDALYIYNGNVAETPNIVNGAVTTALPNQFIGTPTQNQTFRAGGFQNLNPGTRTSTAASGALTFQFDSDFSVTCPGWTAVVAQIPLSGCAMTAPANVTVSTGQFTCTANAVVNAPSFNPAGCNAALNLTYSVDGGAPILIPNPIGPTVTLNNLGSGAHTIVFTLVDPCGNVVVATATSTVTVQDLVPPVITCPAQINITLDPGFCDAIVGYTVTATDNCPFLVPFLATQNPPSNNPKSSY